MWPCTTCLASDLDFSLYPRRQRKPHRFPKYDRVLTTTAWLWIIYTVRHWQVGRMAVGTDSECFVCTELCNRHHLHQARNPSPLLAKDLHRRRVQSRRGLGVKQKGDRESDRAEGRRHTHHLTGSAEVAFQN